MKKTFLLHLKMPIFKSKFTGSELVMAHIHNDYFIKDNCHFKSNETLT